MRVPPRRTPPLHFGDDMAREEKKIKGWKVVYETDNKIHGLKKNKNKFCKKCVDKEDCVKGKMAAIAHCEEFNHV